MYFLGPQNGFQVCSCICTDLLMGCVTMQSVFVLALPPQWPAFN